jgi:predicted metal-dependent HD superfamily phosphohydrolase
MAKEFMLECEASSSVIEFVSDMIMATKDHRSNDDEDAAIMVALDLNIFARDQKRYAEYESQIREEYASVPLAVYCEKRIEILQGFLARPVIYESETMAEIYEEQARMNLAWSVKRLQSELQVE